MALKMAMKEIEHVKKGVFKAEWIMGTLEMTDEWFLIENIKWEFVAVKRAVFRKDGFAGELGEKLT